MWAVAIIAMIVMGSGFMLCASILNTMISNLTKPGQQGLVQGVSRFWASMFRALGPLVVGFIFSIASDIAIPILAFAVLSAGYLTCWVLMFPIKAHTVQKSI